MEDQGNDDNAYYDSEWEKEIDKLFELSMENMPDNVRNYITDNPNNALGITEIYCRLWDEDLLSWKTDAPFDRQEMADQIAHMAGVYIPLANRLGKHFNPAEYAGDP